MRARKHKDHIGWEGLSNVHQESGLTLTHNGVANIRDSGKGEYGSRHRETPEGVDRHREESSEQGNEAVDLNDHSHDGPAQQNHKNAAKKT